MEKKTSMTKREKYIDSLSKQLKKWDHDIEEFEKKNQARFSEIKQDISKRLEALKAKRRKLTQKMDRLKDVGKNTYIKIKKDADKLWKDLENGFATLRKEISK